jgi:PAS domain S-box-containing protein
MKKNITLLVFIVDILISLFLLLSLLINIIENVYFIHLTQIVLLLITLINAKIMYSLIKNPSSKNIFDTPEDIKNKMAIDSSVPTDQKDKLKYEAILAYIGEGLVVINNAGKIITFNKAAESLLGWKEKEALGRDLTDIIKIDYQASISESKLTSSKQSSVYFIRKDNTRFPAAITTTSYGLGAAILGTATLFRDITTEQNIDRMKNEFISLASHQLRTPLSAIKWYTEMLLKGDAGKLLPEQTNYANTIYYSTERMIELVNLLLNISRIESGRITIEPKLTDLKVLIEEILDQVKIRYVDKKHKFITNYHEPIPLINIDPRLIRQVYLNLLTNAAKYTPEKGEISVTITKSETEIISEISDNGYGIPDADQEKLFGKFFRGVNSSTSKSEGTGLGLYLIKDIIDLSRGKIWFKSKESKGTTFWFSLPLSGTPPKKGVMSLES